MESMRAGNKHYETIKELPETIPVFPLSGALLLPGGNMPLNIFEQRYLAMTDYALSNDRLIGMIQPDLTSGEGKHGPRLYNTGCLGRLTGIQETGDGRYMINLSGICRFNIAEELPPVSGFRMVRMLANGADLINQDKCHSQESSINRKLLIDTFRKYLVANEMETDWSAVERTDDETLVTALCMMSPYGPAEKQALLEASDLIERAETLVAITEMALAKADNTNASLQ
jgi:Lon protease-like protein